MKKVFKLFGFIALSMTLAVACGNANTTPAEEEAVVEEQATEVVEETQVEAPAQQVATPAEEKEEEKAISKVEKTDAKTQLLNDAKNVVDEQKDAAKAVARKEVENAKDQLLNEAKEGAKAGSLKKKN